MDETAVRELLHEIAADEAPPCTVDIALARQNGRPHGRRHRGSARRHRFWAAPMAAAAAVALIAALSLAVGLGHRPGAGPNPQHSAYRARPLMTAPREFSALQPYVSFGWLPPGFTSSGLAQLGNSQPTGTSLSLQASAPVSDGRTLMLQVNATGQCTLTGPDRGPSLAWLRHLAVLRASARLRGHQVVSPPPSLEWTYPHGLTCGGPLLQEVAPINGGPAYRGPQGELFWEYGRDAWAELTPALNPLINGSAPADVRSWLNYPPAPPLSRHQTGAGWRQSEASYQLLRKVASRLRFDLAVMHPLYGFAPSGLPASWGAGYTTGLSMLNGRVVSEGWQAGPAVDNTALSISAWPVEGQTPLHCNFVEGQSQYITLDGAQAMLRTIDQSYKHWQELCAPDVQGMQVLMELDLNTPGTNDTPLPGGPEVSSVLTVFRHVHLLGPDVQNWTRQPLR
jgi:hypothetical protein